MRNEHPLQAKDLRVPSTTNVPQTLLATNFVYNSTPQVSVVLQLTSTQIVIFGDIPNTELPQKIFPLDSCLTYRIFPNQQSPQENKVWVLQLNFNTIKIQLKQTIGTNLKEWDAQLKKRINKLGSLENYRLIRRVYPGPDSSVYQIMRVSDNQRFALKAYPKSRLNRSSRHKEGLQTEIRILRQIGELQLKHVQKLEEVYSSNTCFYLIMEWYGQELGFGTIENQLKLSTKEKMRQILTGLESLHQKGIVHRDIKPQNIMCKGNQAPQLMIIDYGLATRVGSSHPFSQAGTIGYVAPQIFSQRNIQNTTPACDIFSLGSIFHQLLLQERLFHAETKEELLRKNMKMEFKLSGAKYQALDKDALDLLRMMLQTDPKVRITAKEALRHRYFKQLTTIKRQPITLAQYLLLPDKEEKEAEYDVQELNGRKRAKYEQPLQ